MRNFCGADNAANVYVMNNNNLDFNIANAFYDFTSEVSCPEAQKQLKSLIRLHDQKISELLQSAVD